MADRLGGIAMTENARDDVNQIAEVLQKSLKDSSGDLAAKLKVDREVLEERLDKELFQSRLIHTQIECALQYREGVARKKRVNFAIAAQENDIDVSSEVDAEQKVPEIRLAFKQLYREPPVRMRARLTIQVDDREPPIVWE
jgi:predicted nucleotidyltransferase